ncbi:biopolymer transport protein ExbB [Salmonella enterica subsp. enterica serovar Sanjuan]|uniref:Biopolymer transport protein ExbB n=1 Tax=Salmonella enterica subsp. enterica serovar Sanjuan TaxID=1160765 RepID=A0A3S4IQN5_SALET|nr:biopolymer transport protein ExbB [Salmonella enterica subsp. enterica serovar Sanjuan]
MGNNLMQTDLSVWGMYQHADIVVKCVMIGLILASVVTWAIFFSKSVEFFTQKRRLKREQLQLADARSLDQASDIAAGFSAKSLSAQLINEAQDELELSQGSEDNEGLKNVPASVWNVASQRLAATWDEATVIWRRSAPFPPSSGCLAPYGAL